MKFYSSSGYKKKLLKLCCCVAAAVAVSPQLSATTIPFSTAQSSQYLIVGTDFVGSPNYRLPDQEFDSNNFELGANKAPVPAPSSYGPGLQGNVPNPYRWSSMAGEVLVGIGGHGNVALTSPGGELNLQDMGVYADADIGLRLAAPSTGSPFGSQYNKSQNSFFNDPNNYPNLLDGTQVAANGNGANVADQTTRIDAPNNAGVTFGYDHSSLLSELETARTTINGLAATAILDVSSNGGVLSTFESGKMPSIIDLDGGTAPVLTSQYFNDGTSFKYDIKLTLESGLNIIDIVTEWDGNTPKLGKDFEIKETNFIIDGPADAFVIFRLLEGSDMLISNGNVLMGQNIGMNNILFYADNENNDTHFNFNNTIINGAAFWSLGDNGGVININNAQGCTQLIADVISLDDVRFNRCAFGEFVLDTGEPVPDGGATLGLLALSAVGLAGLRRKLAA